MGVFMVDCSEIFGDMLWMWGVVRFGDQGLEDGQGLFQLMYVCIYIHSNSTFGS